MDFPQGRVSTRRIHRCWLSAAWVAAVLAAGGVAGCGPYSSVVVTPVAAPAPVVPSVPVASSSSPSLAAIIDRQLQPGHYAEGERALRQYLQQHPGDRAAQGMLRQLTADPEQWLGGRSRAHVVQPGESWSTLADRYLGDANLFLILARYNHSTNPSLLRAGQTLRIPLSARGAAPATEAVSTRAASADPGAVADSSVAKARRLQDESVSLLDQGHAQQALARMDEALAADPRLKPSGAEAAGLRSRLLDSYHERAVVLYRDQQLDKAIALWNRVLAIAPDYEPAIAYRARALELKQRLKQY
ncbi:LysM peptidoglycan-binding domain-containing protein [Rhodanobacter lindaniclasticus]